MLGPGVKEEESLLERAQKGVVEESGAASHVVMDTGLYGGMVLPEARTSADRSRWTLEGGRRWHWLPEQWRMPVMGAGHLKGRGQTCRRCGKSERVR